MKKTFKFLNIKFFFCSERENDRKAKRENYIETKKTERQKDQIAKKTE